MAKKDFSSLPPATRAIWETIEDLRSMMERLMWFNFAQKAVLGALVTHASPEAINTATEALEELAKNEKDAEGREIFEQIAASFKGITETP